MDQFNTLAQALCYLLFLRNKTRIPSLLCQPDPSDVFIWKAEGFPVTVQIKDQKWWTFSLKHILPLQGEYSHPPSFIYHDAEVAY